MTGSLFWVPFLEAESRWHHTWVLEEIPSSRANLNDFNFDWWLQPVRWKYLLLFVVCCITVCILIRHSLSYEISLFVVGLCVCFHVKYLSTVQPSSCNFLAVWHMASYEPASKPKYTVIPLTGRTWCTISCLFPERLPHLSTTVLRTAMITSYHWVRSIYAGITVMQHPHHSYPLFINPKWGIVAKIIMNYCSTIYACNVI